MSWANPIPRGNQASDALGPVEIVILSAVVAGLLVAPGSFVFHLVTGNEVAVVPSVMTSIISALIVLLIFAGVRSSAHDARQLKARGVPGTADVLSAELESDGYSAILRIYVDGLEPFLVTARTGGLLTPDETFEVLVEPADRLFTIVYH